MKNYYITILLLLLLANVFAQKTIENPEYGLSTVSGSITKIDFLDNATVLHFHIKSYSYKKVFVSKKSYIEVVGSDQKLFLTKADGIKINEVNKASATGELFYSLYFPKLEANTEIIDFVAVPNEENDKNNQYVYDIIIDQEKASILPMAIRGDWLRTDGSNRWDYSFHANKAIIDRAVWNYKTLTNKGKDYTIILERKGELKTVYAKLNKNGRVDFGSKPKELKTYSLEKVHNPNYILENDLPYESATLFKMDSTTYSGVIKGYTERVKEKVSISILLHDAFTLRVDPLKVKINEDGSFSIKFSANYPKYILVNSPYASMQEVNVEPGKETFHLINDKTPLFMGDCAMLNAGLKEMDLKNSLEDKTNLKILENISITGTPDDYKKACQDLRDKRINTIQELRKKQFLSAKALQIEKIKMEALNILDIFNYERLRMYAVKEANKDNDEESQLVLKDYTIEPSYYDFIPEELTTDRLGLLVSPFYGFITAKLSSSVNAFEDTDNSSSNIEDSVKKYFGLSEGFMLDFLRFQRLYGSFFDEGYTITDSDLKSINQEIKDPFLASYIMVAAKKAKATQTKITYNINTIQKTENEELFESIIKKFKGKVIYVDFWATWCGICIPAIKRAAPLKEEMKNEDVVFLYITGDNKRSSENKWRQAITEIAGEHYRVSTEEWDYLLKKFQFSGVPRYMLVNKKGEVVNDNIGNPTVKELKAILQEELAKD